jgi:hypothetical protein
MTAKVASSPAPCCAVSVSHPSRLPATASRPWRSTMGSRCPALVALGLTNVELWLQFGFELPAGLGDLGNRVEGVGDRRPALDGDAQDLLAQVSGARPPWRILSTSICGAIVPFGPKRKVLTDYAATALLVELFSARRAP